MRKLLAIALYLSPVLLLGPGCDQAERICDTVCECEHCNDITHNFLCEQVATSRDVADVYDCGEEWRTFADCYESEGECDEDGARFSTAEPGSCSASEDSGIPCMDTNECLNFFFDATCNNGICFYQACNDGNGFECSSDSDCPFGEDRCEDEYQDLQECLIDAADDPAYINPDFD